jgi:hypothetical protein
MTTKYELSLSPDYVADWGVVEATREIFQNAIDQQTVNVESEMIFTYENGVLTIGNKNTGLEAKTLLMGSSSKGGDDKTIGQFGEGYKVATLAFLRLGKRISFYNNKLREVWSPRIVNSRKYDAKILTFFVDKALGKVTDKDLRITIAGITEDEYADIIESNLHLKPAVDVIETERGRILLDENCRGKVFVKGLFVCNYDKYKYGYDFKPQYVKIGRDRDLVSAIDLDWLASSMWNMSGPEHADLVIELARNGWADVKYVKETVHYANSSKKETYDKAHDNFKEEHGENAVPVSTPEELQKVQEVDGAKAVMVSEQHGHLIKSSPKYEESPALIKVSAKDQLRFWFQEAQKHLPEDLQSQFNEIFTELR